MLSKIWGKDSKLREEPKITDDYLPTYFKSRALMSANTTPIPADAKNIRQNRFRARIIASPLPTCNNSSPDEFGITVVVKTIEIASLRMLSPNTSMFSTGSMSRA